MYTTHRGFIALISSVIISTVLMGLALGAGTSGMFARLGALNAEYKRVSLALAESCANVALLKISQDYNYNPGAGEVVTVGVDGQGRTEECTILSVIFPNGKGATNGQNIAVITASAQYPAQNGAFSSVSISAITQDPSKAVPARASLVSQVHVVNDDNSAGKQAGDFTINITASNASPTTFAGTELGQVVYFDPGSYSVSGSSDAAYVRTTGAGCSGSLAAGGTANCTITYDDIPTTATLTATAVVKNDNGGALVPADVDLFINGISTQSGVAMIGLAPLMSHTVSAGPTPPGYTSSVWGSDCTVPGDGTITLFAGQKKTCTIVYDDLPPPAPICVDTIMMLDRTGSMGSSDLSDERAAANGLLSLYDDLVPLPKSAIGVFGAVGSGEPYNAAITQQLTTNYASLMNAVNSGLSSSGGFTNLASAINVSQSEFAARGTPGKGHVLILLSDGGTNRPTGSVAADTGWKSPTANAQNASGDAWSAPAGAYGASYASDTAGHRHRYSTLGLGVPTGATITNVEVRSDAWSTLQLSSQTFFTENFGTGNNDNDIDNWDEEGSENDSTTLAAQIGSGNDTASPDGGRFARIGQDEWICRNMNGSGRQSMTLAYYWRGDSDAEASDKVYVEYNTNGSNCDTNSGWVQVPGGQHDLNNTSWSGLQTLSLPVALDNDNSFLIRFRVDSSSSDENARIDGVSLSSLTNTACTLGVDLSWNGGTTWTNEDTQLLTNASAQYTFSGSWGGHTWVPADFTDANFRIRIRDTNAGPTCIVDTLQARVSYTTTSNPYEAALAAADAAKLAGTDIFTIHFGDDGPNGNDQDFLATLASGTTANGSHQPGSANDQSGSAVSGSVGPNAPSATNAPSGWSNATRAYSSDNQYTTSNNEGTEQGYKNFGLVLPPGAQVSGIRAEIEGRSSDSNGCELQTMLSWNGGTSWTSADDGDDDLSGSDQTIYFGSSGSLWGRTWAAPEFSDANFALKFRFDDTSGNNCNNATVSVDRVRVQVYYVGAVPENVDGDNFFISPNSSDMQSIFTFIGQQVCPALSAPPPAPLPTYGTLYVVTQVVNDNGGSAEAGDFPVTVTGTNPSPGTFAGTVAPGVAVTLTPGFYSADEDIGTLLYAKTRSAGCSGTINAGDVLTCSIVNDDLPPPPPPTATPPPPPSTIIIGSWQEQP